jgi:beta-glucosidase
MWVNPEINASDAFVAAWLPGGEGGGIADVLFANADGSVRNDFRGRLSYSWPRRVDQTPLNRGDPDYDPLFAYGFGLRYADNGNLAPLSEERPANEGLPEGLFFSRGTLPAGWRFGADPAVRITGLDRRAQEDARAIAWTAAGTAWIEAAPPADINREATGELSLILDLRLDSPLDGEVAIGINAASVPVAGLLRGHGGEWQTLVIPLRCLARAGVTMNAVARPLTIRSAAPLRVALSDVRLGSTMIDQNRCGQP